MNKAPSERKCILILADEVKDGFYGKLSIIYNFGPMSIKSTN